LHLSQLRFEFQRIPDDARIHDAVSVVHLRRYKGEGTHIRPRPIVAEDNEMEYEVEGIQSGRSTKSGEIQYLVEWLGYDDHERTWELLELLGSAQEALDEAIQRNSKTPPLRQMGQPSPQPGNSLQVTVKFLIDLRTCDMKTAFCFRIEFKSNVLRVKCRGSQALCSFGESQKFTPL
jgi:hypothetical protein